MYVCTYNDRNKYSSIEMEKERGRVWLVLLCFGYDTRLLFLVSVFVCIKIFARRGTLQCCKIISAFCDAPDSLYAIYIEEEKERARV